MSLTNQTALDHYIEVLQNLRLDTLEALANCCAEDVVFKDPFNHTQSKHAYLAVMKDMFESLNDVRFVVEEAEATEKGAYLTWFFTANSRLTGTINVQGMSRIVFNAEGKVSQHMDYWDGSVVMEAIPLFGAMVRAIKKRAAHKP